MTRNLFSVETAWCLAQTFRLWPCEAQPSPGTAEGLKDDKQLRIGKMEEFHIQMRMELAAIAKNQEKLSQQPTPPEIRFYIQKMVSPVIVKTAITSRDQDEETSQNDLRFQRSRAVSSICWRANEEISCMKCYTSKYLETFLVGCFAYFCVRACTPAMGIGQDKTWHYFPQNHTRSLKQAQWITVIDQW